MKKPLTKAFRRKPKDEGSRFYATYLQTSQPVAQAPFIGIGDDDAGSIESFSTTATIDDNPGTVLDTYFFQPAGRRIERLAMRFTIRYLYPWRIASFIDRVFGSIYYLPQKITLSDALNNISDYPDSPTVVAGLKGLVQQAQ